MYNGEDNVPVSGMLGKCNAETDLEGVIRLLAPELGPVKLEYALGITGYTFSGTLKSPEDHLNGNGSGDNRAYIASVIDYRNADCNGFNVGISVVSPAREVREEVISLIKERAGIRAVPHHVFYTAIPITTAANFSKN